MKKQQATSNTFKGGCGKIKTVIEYSDGKDGKPSECDIRLGKGGNCAQAQNEAIGRLITLNLKHGVDTSEIIKQLIGIKCNVPLFNDPYNDGEDILSCSDAIAKSFKRWEGDCLESTLNKGETK